MCYFFYSREKYIKVVLASFFSACLFCLLSSNFIYAEESAGLDSLSRFLPPESRLVGWELDASPQTAEGPDLFRLINGGAEAYLKEGFKRALLASYSNSKGKMINLEIFEMTSSESAMSIHKIKTGEKGKKVQIGDDAVIEDYYINFRKGRYQVTLSGYDSEEETVKLLLEIASLVADKIHSLP